MKTKKCFSKCRQIPENICKEKSRLCQFTRGTRKYCRISKFYTLDKNCNMIKKKQKMIPGEASKKIGQFILNKTKKYKLIQQNNLKKQEASRKIGKFVLKNRNKLTAFFLKTICSDSGVCIAFGTEITKLNNFFNNFTDFEYAVSPIKRIGEVSNNGFIKEVKYSREGYDAYAILKSAFNKKSDNLMYEYEVGQFINKKNKLFPCFLETYGLFIYKDEDEWKHAKNTETISADVLKNSFYDFNEIDYSVGCPESRDVAILIQHIKNAITIDKFIQNILIEPDKNKKIISINYELLYILYQIYMPLATLSHEFTHYDLHTDNVLLYEPIKDGYITYNYHLNSGKVIKFNSKYIAKIIDYGRCYYKDGTYSSKDTYEAICKIKDCDPACGEDYGLINLAPEDPPGSFYYITSQKRNMSADLRLSFRIQNDLGYNSEISKKFNDLLYKIVFTERYGTKERVKSGLPIRVNNVIDFCKELEDMIDSPEHIFYNSRFNTYQCIGEFHIYENGNPMRFEPAYLHYL
jgi:hypothetical protein